MMSNKLEEQKKALYGIIKPYFEKLGFSYINSIPERFVKDDNSIIYKIGFDFKERTHFQESSPLIIIFTEVEDIIIEIGEPNYNYSSIKKYDLFTIRRAFSDSYNKKFNQIDLSMLLGFEQWGKLIIEYMETEGKAFMEYYSYLPNVLNEMDRLEVEGKYWNEIIVGLADYDFRGLIISKLCNDPNFNTKIESRDEIFFKTPQLSEWLPYYEKLKERLKTVEPKYNV